MTRLPRFPPSATLARALLLPLLLAWLPTARAEPDPAPATPTERDERAARMVGLRTGATPASSVSARLAGEKPLRGPVDEEQYVVGPGDALAVTVSGASVDTQRLEVTPEGDVVFPGIATTRVAGLRLVEAKERIRDALTRHFRNVEIRISLASLRRLEVHVTGNVSLPGTYIGTAMDPASTLVDMAGGLGAGASQRNIRITRRNGEQLRVDLLRYQRLGDLAANPPILDGDVLFVPFVKTRIRVDGAVESPALYEFVDGDTLGTLVDIAGGVTRDARTDSVEVRRFTDDVNTESLLLPLSEARSLPLRDGDQVYVRYLTEHRPMTIVTLEGEFAHPGPYGISEGRDTLAGVIRRAGGFTDAASLQEGELIRTTGVDKTDLEYERLKTIPVQDMSETEYAYFKGKARERKGLVVVDFVRLAAGDEREDRILQNGDRVMVPTRRATVKVSGSVKFPGLITYEPDRRASFYIELAGGYASRADRGGARVIKSVTSEWEPLGRAGVIVPGDEVWVPEQPERDWWQFAQDAVRFAASIATVYLVIDQATR